MRTFSGECLKKCRKSSKMSRMGLARAIDFKVGPKTIYQYERGLSVPNVNVAVAIAAALGVTLKELSDAKG